MLKRLKQLKRLWKLTNKDPEYLKAIEFLSEDDIKNIPDKKGNGNAIFIPEMNDEERNEYLLNQEPIWERFHRRLKEIIGDK